MTAATSPPTTQRPDVSVVIPTRNRPEKLGACLEALAAQRFTRDRFEVIVIDDGSDKSLEPTVDPFRTRLRVTLVVQRNAGPARARNEGARRAAGTLLAFTDDDCEPDPDWISELQAAHKQDGAAALGGHTINALPQNPWSTASQLLVDYLYEYHAGQPASASPPFFTSNNFAAPATLFHAVGGFDESFPLAAGEDRELCDRWQQLGFRLRRVPGAVIRHGHVLALKSYWRQHMNYGRGAFHLGRARQAGGRPPLSREPLTFYWQLVTHPLRSACGPPVQLVTLMFLSQVANVLGFIVEARNARKHGTRNRSGESATMK